MKSSMTAQPPEDTVHPKTRAEWLAWLQETYNRDEGIWFNRYKKDCGVFWNGNRMPSALQRGRNEY